ncbi:MAG: DUF72 domain-containing protein [Chloroflexota bacterium]
MVDWYIGTMGFGYKDWSGVFYPAELKASGYLRYYSRIFDCVEVDSTFYGTPRPQTVQRWALATPPSFRFCLKTPRLITHEAGLVGVDAAMGEFLEVARELGERLGVVLIQLPPSFDASRLPVLVDFVQRLPGDLRFAVEVRHQSWYTAGVADEALPLAQALARQGVCWAATEFPGLPGGFRRTSDFLYVRWVGQHGAFQQHSQERIDRDANLQAWWQQFQDQLPYVQAVFGQFNNDYAGFAAGSADRFKRIAGLPREPFPPAQQVRLF